MRGWGAFRSIGGSVLLALFVTVPLAAQEPLRFAPGVVRELSALYTHYAPDEYVACLHVDPAGVVTGFDIPRFQNVRLAGPGVTVQRGVRDVQGCEDFDSRITLHSHPAGDRDSLCFLPLSDVRKFRERTQDTHIAIICGLGILWWSRDQVKDPDVRKGEIPKVMYAVPGQFAPFAR